MTGVWQDLRFSFRILTKQPHFTLVAMLIIAAGVGATTAVFSVINAVLLRPLPYADPARLVAVTSLFKSASGQRSRCGTMIARPPGREDDTMRVSALMTATPITVTPETSVVDARHLMATSKIRHLLVTDGTRLVGIVTDRDIRLNLPSPATSLSVWELNYLLARLVVREVMSRGVITIGPERDAAEAARIMIEHKIGALPVLEGDRLIGIVTETDFLRAFALDRHHRVGPKVFEFCWAALCAVNVIRKRG